ncbi:nucleotide pyrophosphohydrolase [Kitasatospora sp. NPDC052868]|uniref:nucleotide pyrophosphohydrolase n=1 Tax=Kitasatospora sp. NPDC052868 TaxID=3364060 RepID=UPI0037C7065E
MSDQKRLHDAVHAVRDAYDQLNDQRIGRRWDLTDYALGFAGDVGDLAKLVMAHEGHRIDVTADRARVAHELSDCLFSLLVIAEETGIDLEARFPADMAALAARIRAQLTTAEPAPTGATAGKPPPTATGLPADTNSEPAP